MLFMACSHTRRRRWRRRWRKMALWTPFAPTPTPTPTPTCSQWHSNITTFINENVGSYDHESNVSIFASCALNKLLKMALCTFLQQLYSKQSDECSIFFLSDGAFPPLHYIIKPFQASHMGHDERIYNYRISRARSWIQNCFGIMAMEWRILQMPIETCHKSADHIAWAS